MSMACGEAVPRMLLMLVPSPGVFFGNPARIAASITPEALVPPSASLMFSCAKTVLTEWAVAFRRSILPNCSPLPPPKFGTLPRGSVGLAN